MKHLFIYYEVDIKESSLENNFIYDVFDKLLTFWRALAAFIDH